MKQVAQFLSDNDYVDYKIIKSNNKYHLVEIKSTVDLENFMFPCSSIIQDNKELLENVPDILFRVCKSDDMVLFLDKQFPTFASRNLLGIHRMNEKFIHAYLGMGRVNVVFYRIVQVLDGKCSFRFC